MNMNKMTNAELFAAALKADCDNPTSCVYFCDEWVSIADVSAFFHTEIKKRGCYEEYEAHLNAYEEWEKAAMFRLPEADNLKAAFLDTIPND